MIRNKGFKDESEWVVGGRNYGYVPRVYPY